MKIWNDKKESIDIHEGLDLTNFLSIEKYIPYIPAQLAGQIKGQFPSYLKRTDEQRVQSVPEVCQEFNGKKVYISVKIDGTSGTFAHLDEEKDVCSRNLSLLETEGNAYWDMYRKYDLEEKLNDAGNYSVQGEIAGQGIQKNRLKLPDVQLFVFNVYDIKKGTYLDYEPFMEFCINYELQTVPIITDDMVFKFCLEELLEMAKGRYESGKHREGIVIRLLEEEYSEVLEGRSSFKVINNDFLLDGGD